MKGLAFATPVLVLALLPLLHLLEVWMRHDPDGDRRRKHRPQRKVPPVCDTPAQASEAQVDLPVPRDPPPPPGWVDPLAGTAAQDTSSRPPSVEYESAGHSGR